MVLGWFADGMRMVRGWYADGTRMVRGWYADGTRMARGWYADGMRMVHGWYADGTRIDRDGTQIDGMVRGLTRMGHEYQKNRPALTFEGPIRLNLITANDLRI